MGYFKDKKPPAIRACLFDMDGLLIDSEDLYTKCTNMTLHEYGRPDLPWNIKAKLQGRPAPEAGRILFEWAKLPVTPEEFHAKVRTLQTKYFPSAQPLPGVEVLLETLNHTTSPNIHMALATSSRREMFELKTGHLQPLLSCFKEENRVLGDDHRIPPGRGKPAPDIYMLALKTLNESIRKTGSSEQEILPEECLVFEDAVPGVEAGRRAGMQVLWCPHAGLLNEYQGREKEVLAGLTGEHVDDAMVEITATAEGRVTGGPGEIDDGWGTLVPSLVDFPYERFHIRK